jgi:tetratricopeptide (TPR) repeat protein
MRHLIGLGFRCDVAFQLRMHGSENVAHFFDWLATPVEGVVKIIEADFDVFHPDHLVLLTDHSPHSVADKLTGVNFYHQFPLFAGHMQPDFLLFYDSFIKKFQHLANRFRTYLRTKPVTLVRLGITHEQALRLEEVVLARFPGADVRFLYVVNNGEEFQTANGHARLLKGDGSSLGDPAEWVKLLTEEGLIGEPYRHGTVEILGSAHDDHNLSTDNRFSEVQLLAAIAGNPQNPVFPLELSRWYMARGKLKQAEEMAVAALARNPNNPEAIYQATLTQWKTGRFTVEMAAETFCGVVEIAKPMPSWLREASAALLDAGRTEIALVYANKAVAADPLDQRNYLQKAMCLYYKKDFALGELAMTAAMNLGRVSYVYYHIHAKLLDGLGRVEEAVDAERRALEAGGDSFQSWFNLANLLAGLGRNRDALEACQAALPLAGVHIGALEARILELRLKSNEDYR